MHPNQLELAITCSFYSTETFDFCTIIDTDNRHQLVLMSEHSEYLKQYKI